MTNEERDLISRFIERVAGARAPGQAVAGQGAVAPLPAVDGDADRLIADLFNQYPEARYRLTQMAFVQEHALVEAQNRISRLQWELQQAQAATPQGGGAGNPAWGAAGQAPQSRGFFSSLFGGSGGAASGPQYAQPQYAPPPPQYPAGYNPGLFQQQGSGFFGSALRTAAGVAGGVLAADALMSMFSGGHGGGFGGGFGGGGLFGGPAQAAEFGGGGVPVGANLWGGGGDSYDASGAAKDDAGGDKFAGPATVDQSAWSPAPSPDQGGGDWRQADNTGWQDAPANNSGQGGGWDTASNDASSNDGGWSDNGGGGGNDDVG